MAPPAKTVSGGSDQLASGRLWDAPSAERERISITEPSGYESTPSRTTWLSRDPIEEEGGLNLYGYVGNDPVRWFDLLGLAPQDKDYSCIANALQEGIKDLKGTEVPESELMGKISPTNNYDAHAPAINLKQIIPPIAKTYGVTATPIRPDDIPNATRSGPVMATKMLPDGKTHEVLIETCPNKGSYKIYDPKTGERRIIPVNEINTKYPLLWLH